MPVKHKEMAVPNGRRNSLIKVMESSGGFVVRLRADIKPKK